MQDTNSRTPVVAAIDAEQALWHQLASRATPATIDAPLNEAWTFGELAKHLLAWSEISLERFEARAEGRPMAEFARLAESDDVDSTNAFFRERDKNLDTQDAIVRYSATFDRWRRLVEQLPESAIDDPDFYPDLEGQSILELVTAGDFFQHLTVEHASEIEAWTALTAGRSGNA